MHYGLAYEQIIQWDAPVNFVSHPATSLARLYVVSHPATTHAQLNVLQNWYQNKDLTPMTRSDSWLTPYPQHKWKVSS